MTDRSGLTQERRARSSTIRVLSALFAVLAVAASCAAGDDADVVWDFREPVTATELDEAGPSELVAGGFDIAGFTPQDGKVLLAILPTGDRIFIEGEATAYRSNFFGNNPQGGVIDQLLYTLFLDGTADDVREAAAEFTERWGIAIDEDNDPQTLTEATAGLTDDVEYDIGDRSANNFETTETNGVVANLSYAVARGNTWAVFIGLNIRPALPADA